MAEQSESDRLCTFKEVKDYLMGTLDRSKPGSGKIPMGAQQNVWMCMMPPPSDTYNEVYPNIFIGDGKMGQDPDTLKAAGVTHIVNCAMGKKFSQVDTNEEFFAESGIKFHGFVATDILTCKIARHFDAAVEFIDTALKEGGKVYAHCRSGKSRSATIVLAFLMTKRDMPMMDAMKVVRDKRRIFPNDGFLSQLIDLNNKLYGDNSKTRPRKVYVHCVSGVSRSATIALAFLMAKRDMPMMEAVKVVRDKRKILPNDGFLRELIDLNNKLYGNDSKTTS